MSENGQKAIDHDVEQTIRRNVSAVWSQGKILTSLRKEVAVVNKDLGEEVLTLKTCLQQPLVEDEELISTTHQCRRICEVSCSVLLQTARFGIPKTSNLTDRLLWLQLVPKILHADMPAFLTSRLLSWSQNIRDIIPVLNIGSHTNTIVNIKLLRQAVDVVCTALTDYSSLNQELKITVRRCCGPRTTRIRKSKICVWNAQGGQCNKGPKCSYAHSYEEIRAASGLL